MAFFCKAQSDFAVQIKADNNQPFYVMINGKNYNSSTQGNVILTGLQAAVYDIKISFPKDVYPTCNFTILLSKDNLLYQLKDVPGKGWVLFNPSAGTWFMPEKKESQTSKQSFSGGIKKEDAFSRLMAGVVNDTLVMYNSYVDDEPETVKAPTSTASANKPPSAVVQIKTIEDSSTKTTPNNVTKATTVNVESGLARNDHLKQQEEFNKNEAVKINRPIANSENTPAPQADIHTTKVTTSVAPKETATTNLGNAKNVEETKPSLYKPINEPKRLSFVKMVQEQKSDSSLILVFADVKVKGGIDTIELTIPLDMERRIAATKQPDPIKNEISPVNSIIKEATAKAQDSPVAITHEPVKDSMGNSKIENNTKVEEKPAAAETVMNNQCRFNATDYDIDKLRVQLMSIPNDEDKVISARSLFKLKCLSVKQVLALNELFKTDEGKYRFFDAVYSHVSDVGNFVQLESLLSDPYYINRFKAMIR